jgi:hypothetical protein
MNVIFIEATDNLFTKPYIYGRKSVPPDEARSYLIQSYDEISKYFEKIPGTTDLYYGKPRMKQYLLNKPFMVIGNYLFQKVKDQNNVYQRINIVGAGAGVGAGMGAGVGTVGVPGGVVGTGTGVGTGAGAGTGPTASVAAVTSTVGNLPPVITIKEIKDKDGNTKKQYYGNKELVAKYKKNPYFFTKTEIGTGVYFDNQRKKYILRGNPNNLKKLPYFVIPQRLSRQNYTDVINSFLKQKFGNKPVFTSTYKKLPKKYQTKKLSKFLGMGERKFVNMVVDSYSWDGDLYYTRKETGISELDFNKNVKFFLIRVNFYLVPEKVSMRERVEMNCIYHRNKIRQLREERQKLRGQGQSMSLYRQIEFQSAVSAVLPRYSSGRYAFKGIFGNGDGNDGNGDGDGWDGDEEGDEDDDQDGVTINSGGLFGTLFGIPPQRKKASVGSRRNNYGYKLGNKYDDIEDDSGASGRVFRTLSTRQQLINKNPPGISRITKLLNKNNDNSQAQRRQSGGRKNKTRKTRETRKTTKTRKTKLFTRKYKRT